MEVYIEFVVLDNLIINYVLLNFVNLTLKLNAKKYLMLLSSCVGMIVAIFLPLLSLHNMVLFIIKLLLGIIMILIIKKQKNIKQYLLAYLLFLTYTFVLGGMCFGLMFMLNMKTTFSGVILYNFEIPISLFVLLVLFYSKLLFKLIRNIQKKFVYHTFYYDVKITHNNKSVYISAFLDSGNHIEIDNGGVNIINLNAFIKLFPNINYQQIILGNLKNCGLKNAEFINVGSAVSSNKMLIFNVDQIEIIKDDSSVLIQNAKLGLTKSKFSNNFDCLLSPVSLKGDYYV